MCSFKLQWFCSGPEYVNKSVSNDYLAFKISLAEKEEIGILAALKQSAGGKKK